MYISNIIFRIYNSCYFENDSACNNGDPVHPRAWIRIESEQEYLDNYNKRLVSKKFSKELYMILQRDMKEILKKITCQVNEYLCIGCI